MEKIPQKKKGFNRPNAVNPSTLQLGSAAAQRDNGRIASRKYDQKRREEKAEAMAKAAGAAQAAQVGGTLPLIGIPGAGTVTASGHAPLAVFGLAAPLHPRSPVPPATHQPTSALRNVTFPMLGGGTPSTMQSAGSSGGSLGVGSLSTASTSSLSSRGSQESTVSSSSSSSTVSGSSSSQRHWGSRSVSFASAEGSQKIKRGMEGQAEEMISTLADNLRGIYKGKLAEGESGVNLVKQLFTAGLSKAVKRVGGESMVGGIASTLGHADDTAVVARKRVQEDERLLCCGGSLR
jgi:hypothetical protein